MLGRRNRVLSRLLAWNRRRKQWNIDHVAAWAGQDVPGRSGLSPFQEMFEPRLIEALGARGLSLENRALGGNLERYVHGKLVGGLWDVWIYIDQVQAVGPHPKRVDMEQWDALTPDDLAREFLVCLMREIDNARSR